MKKLDLHGFTTDEVFDAVDSFLLKASKSSDKVVQIITGKGKGLVQKEVIRYLKLSGYNWSYEKLKNGKQNTGVLVIHMS